MFTEVIIGNNQAAFLSILLTTTGVAPCWRAGSMQCFAVLPLHTRHHEHPPDDNVSTIYLVISIIFLHHIFSFCTTAEISLCVCTRSKQLGTLLIVEVLRHRVLQTISGCWCVQSWVTESVAVGPSARTLKRVEWQRRQMERREKDTLTRIPLWIPLIFLSLYNRRLSLSTNPILSQVTFRLISFHAPLCSPLCITLCDFPLCPCCMSSVSGYVTHVFYLCPCVLYKGSSDGGCLHRLQQRRR